MGWAVPPARVISRATVWMVEAGELGSGGKGAVGSGEVADLAAMITVSSHYLLARIHVKYGHGETLSGIPVYPFFARSIAIWRPMPREAPTTRATGLGDRVVMMTINRINQALCIMKS